MLISAFRALIKEPEIETFHWKLCIQSFKNLLQCPIALSIWNWLSSCLGKSIDCSSIKAIFSVYNQNWSHRLKDVVLATIINVIYSIWHLRNKIRFDNVKCSVNYAKSLVSAAAQCLHQWMS